MVGFLTNFGTSFILGLLTPLTAVCVIPLYPGFLAFLSSRFTDKDKLEGKSEKKQIALLGILVTLGVITFMLGLGLLFTTFLQVSLTKVIGIVSPIAFALLGIISIFLIFDVNFGKFLPKIKNPKAKNPLLNAFLFGLFFGAIIIPCNPAFIAAFFARVALTANAFTNLINFFLFGLGIGTPLLLFALVSAAKSQQIIGFLVKYKSTINRSAGVIMLVISLYYLLCVFNLLGGLNICGYLGAFIRG